MKRVLLIIVIIILLFSFCACTGKTPSAKDMKKLIPQTIDLNPENYPLLHQAPPTVNDILGDTPRTFVFDESAWTRTESEYDEYGYKSYIGTDGMMLLHIPDTDYYQITRGTMNPDLSVSDDFLWIEYHENGELFSYRNNQYGCYFGEETTESYENGKLTDTRSFTYFDVEINVKNGSYRYTVDPQTNQVSGVQVEQISINSSDCYDYLSFTYNSENNAIDFASKLISTRSGHYMCEYDSSGNLQTISYYPNDLIDTCYVYDKNYNFIKQEKLN